MLLYVYAIKKSPISLIVPFLSFTPVFLILNAYVIAGDKVTPVGVFGIMLVVLGSFVLNHEGGRSGFLRGFMLLTKDTGVRAMMIVAFIYSITSSMGKVAILHSSPVFFASSYFIVVTIIMAPIVWWKGYGDFDKFKCSGSLRNLALSSLMFGIMVITHMIAISLTNVAYMISVKRSSVLIGVIYGYAMFKEGNIRKRFLGAMLMFIGIILILNAT